MKVNRSSYYKWLANKDSKNRFELDREILTELLLSAHQKNKSYGYHRLAAKVKRETGWIFSDNLAHKCCKFAGIKSVLRKTKYNPTAKEHIYYPNYVKNNWNASKPLELIVSDMTNIKHNGQNYELTYLLDTYNNEIISHHMSCKAGDRMPYFKCLEDLKGKIEKTAHLVLHTDQGAVYSSQAFKKAHENYNIIRSMSRVGTPTDNPIIESINGWIKEEMRVDFGLKNTTDIRRFISDYIEYYNNERPAYALQYKSPVQYRIEQGFV